VALLVILWGCAGPLRATAAAEDSPLQRAAILRSAGKLDQALDVLRAESRDIKKRDGDDSVRLLPINDLAAEILIDKGDIETAATLLEKTIATREKLVATGTREQSAPLGRSLLTRARLETAANRLPAAADAARRSLLAFDAAPDRNAEDIASSRESLERSVNAIDGMLGSTATTREARGQAAGTFTSLSMYPEAIEQRRRILAGIIDQRDATAADILDATDRLGRLMLEAGQAEEALEIVARSLERLEPDHPQEANSVRRLIGALQMAAGKLVLARGTFAVVLESTQAEAKPAASLLAGDRLRRLLVDVLRGEADRVPEWFDQAVKSLTKPMPTEVAAAIPGLVAAAEVREALGDSAAAADLIAKALALAGTMKPPDPGQLAALSGLLTTAQRAAGDRAAARKTAERALPEAERGLGPGDPRVGLLRIQLADALARAGENGRAVALAEKAVERGLPRPDEAWEERTTAIVDRLASAAAADQLRERYLAMRARQFGKQHPHVASAYGWFGAASLAAGDWAKAIDFFSRAIALQQAAVTSDTPEAAANTVLLAHAQRAAGEVPKAAATAAQGLAAWERVAGANHPGTLAAIEVLVDARIQLGDTAGMAELLERLCDADAIDAPVRRATHLVRLADIMADTDKDRALKLLAEAMHLSCWQEGVITDADVRLRLAFTAALAAHAFTASGDSAAAKDAVQRARRLVVDVATPEPLYRRIDELATRGERPKGGN
jgi:tetratricopeptide (TPR) repeat protein